jgi:hypothetical protein
MIAHHCGAISVFDLDPVLRSAGLIWTVPVLRNLTRRLVHGATLGADNTVLAAMQAPLEAYRRGVGLSEGYAYSKAREDQILSDARRNTGALGTASELIGGGWPVEDLLMRA